MNNLLCNTIGSSDKRWNGMPLPILIMVLALTLGINSGCTTLHTTSIKNDFPGTASVHLSGPTVTVLQIEEALQGSSDMEAYKEDPTYLGKGLYLYIAFGPIYFPPMLVQYSEFHADESRTAIVQTEILLQLKEMGMPVNYLPTGEISKVRGLPDNQLAISVRIRSLNEDTSGVLILPLIITSNLGFTDEVATVDLDCRLWQGGNIVPLWEGVGKGQAKSDKKDKNWKRNSLIGEAVFLAVEQCLTKSKIVDVRTKLSNEMYAKLLENAGQQEKVRANNQALNSLIQAYNSALTPAQSLEVIKELSRLIRSEGRTPVLPEDARKFRVEAEGALNDKKFQDASNFFEQAIWIAPWSPSLHFNRALVLGELGDYPTAEQEMRDYLELVPNAPDYRAAQDKIYEWESKAGTQN